MRVLGSAKQIFMAGWIIAVAAGAETDTWYQKVTCAPIAYFRSGSEVVFNDRIWLLDQGLSSANGIDFETEASISPECSCSIEASAVFEGKIWTFVYWSGFGSTVWSSEDGEHWGYPGLPSAEPSWLVINLPPEAPLFYISGYSVASHASRLWLLGGLNAQGGEGEFQVEGPGKVMWTEDGQEWSGGNIAAWSGRSYQKSVVHNGRIWILGGVDFHGLYNDVWSSEDGLNWIEETPAAPWQARAMHGCVVHDGKIWVLGGVDASYNFLADVWYSANGVDWTLQTEAAPWGPRRKHAVVSFQEELLVIGGERKGNPDSYRDIWAYGTNPPAPETHHSADSDGDNQFSLSEVLRVIQLYNSGGVSCACDTEDNFAPGAGMTACTHHASDYNPQDWRIQLTELLRVIQFYNVGGYTHCRDAGTEDGFCPGSG